MKTQRIITLASTIAFIFCMLTAQANDTFTKEITQEYNSTASSVVDISNKFGAVEIISWDQNKVSFLVTITVETRNESAAERFFEKIDIEFSNQDDVLKAVTDINGNLNGDFSIDYTVKMPNDIKLNIVNKYGDIAINEHHGKVNLTVKYGVLRANKLLSDDSKPRSQITLAYSDDSSIGECNWLNIDASYSSLEIEKSKALVLVTKYSEMSFEDAVAIVSDSKYDDYEVENVQKFVIYSKYTDVEIENITTKLEAEMGYADLEISNVASSFTLIDVDAKYTDVDISMASGAAYYLEIEGKYLDVSFPDVSELNIEDDLNDTKVWGNVGNGGSATVKIEADYGDVRVK